MIDTISEVAIYEENGRESAMIDGPVLVVKSVRPLSERVEIVVGGHGYTVMRRDLEAALAATAHEGAR